MNNRIGVIAEDKSDVEVIEALIYKITPGKQFTIRKFVAHGCGKIIGKCQAWATALRNQQCRLLIVLHDLDDRNQRQLRQRLHQALTPCPIERHTIIIPVKEIEAWLLCDNQAIQRAFNLRDEIPVVNEPESIIDPKKKIEELVYSRSQKTKRYINTLHNKKIATLIEISYLKRCQSFIPLEQFIRQNLK